MIHDCLPLYTSSILQNTLIQTCNREIIYLGPSNQHIDTAKMPELKAGDSFPEGVSFTYVPPSPEKADIIACGVGVKYDASKGELQSTST